MTEDVCVLLLNREPEKFLETIKVLQQPPKKREEYLSTLEKQRLGKIVDAIRETSWTK